jgi:hypothetical protein
MPRNEAPVNVPAARHCTTAWRSPSSTMPRCSAISPAARRPRGASGRSWSTSSESSQLDFAWRRTNSCFIWGRCRVWRLTRFSSALSERLPSGARDARSERAPGAWTDDQFTLASGSDCESVDVDVRDDCRSSNSAIGVSWSRASAVPGRTPPRLSERDVAPLELTLFVRSGSDQVGARDARS